MGYQRRVHGESRPGLSTANIHTYPGVMQALYVVPLLAAAASAAPQLLVGGHAPLVHGVAAPAVVAHPVAHAVAHPFAHAIAHPVAHAVAHPVAVAASADPLAEVPPYNFNYAVADDYSASNFQAAESSDGLRVKTGSYSVALPDGRTQTVNYSTDDVNGYVADVSYEGVPQYPPVAAPVAVAHPTVALAHPVAHAVAHPVAHAVAHPAVSIAHPATTLIG